MTLKGMIPFNFGKNTNLFLPTFGGLVFAIGLFGLRPFQLPTEITGTRTSFNPTLILSPFKLSVTPFMFLNVFMVRLK